ncbi:MAG: hypothetical protein ACERK9_11830, partial [Deltaproteobacteria bacterium]
VGTEKISLKPRSFQITSMRVNPNVADLHRGKTRQSAPDVAARRLGQVEAYLTYVIACPGRAQPQMVCYGASAAILSGVGLQH